MNDEAYLVVDDGKDDSNNYDADADAAVSAVGDFDDGGTGLNTNNYNNNNNNATDDQRRQIARAAQKPRLIREQ